MVEVTLEEFEKNFDAYMDRIETEGAEFLIRKPDGRAVVAVPASKVEHLNDQTHALVTDEWYNTYNNHDDAS